MALQSALTNDQLTDIRSGVYQTLQFVCTVPNETVVQFQPSAAPSTDVFAEITVGSISTGSMSDIEEGQLVIFSTSTDYVATEFFRTRVRKVSGTTTLYVAENSQTLTTAHYVTVLNTYEVQEKLRRDTTRVDWDITFRKLRPIETALQSAYVLTNGVTSFEPTASPVVMDADAASISTHAWSSSNANDTLDSGGTTASPSFTLEAGAFRWIRYTFIDNLGLSNYRVIPVWTVEKDYSSVVQLGFGGADGNLANVSFDAELGWTCTVPAFAGITSLLNRTLTVVACDEWYGGVTNSDRQSIRTNINFIGYLQNESVQTSADEQAGQISEATFTVESFGHQLARQNMSPVTVIQKATSAAAWDEIKNPTPGRMLTYRLTEYSTASSLMAIALPSDDTDFIGDDLTLSTEKALDDLVFIAEGYNAEIQFDITGKLEMCRDLNYRDTTTRDNAPVVATLTPADFVGQYRIDYEYGKTVSQATITGGSYNTSQDRYALFEAITPAEARYTEGDPFELPNQVLTTDNTAAESIAEIADRAANHLAAQNPTWTLSGQLKDQWYFLLPDVGAWFKFTIAATDTVRGKAFGSNDRWQLVQIDVSTNPQTGTREVNATFRHETSSTGASVRVAPIIHDENADIDYVPGVLPPLTGGDTSLTDGTWYDSQSTQPPSDQNPVDEDCEATGFRVRDYFHETDGVALNNEYVGITVRGSGRIDVAESYIDYDFTTSDNGFVAVNGDYQAGVGFVGENIDPDPDGTDRMLAEITKSLPANEYKIFAMGIRYIRSGGNGVGDNRLTIQWRDGVNPEPGGDLTFAPSNATEGRTWTNSEQLSTELYALNRVNGNTSSSPQAITTKIRIWLTDDSPTRGTGHSNPPSGLHANGNTSEDYWTEGGDEDVFGDAFYYWTGTQDTPNSAPTPYPDGFGLLVEGFAPLSIPPYNPSHEYALDPMQVNSGPVDFTYEPLFGTGGLTNWSLQLEVCFLGTDP